MKRILKYVMVLVLLLVVCVGVVFVQFTSLGYRMTVGWRNFSELEENVYVYDGYGISNDEIISVVNEAKNRVRSFWTDVTSDPVIILCDDEKVLSKLGGDHDTSTAVIFQAHSYISISSQYFNVDILAHEMTPAELHKRLYAGKFWYNPTVPIWFDEGLALQNDYRVQYGEDTWIEKTDNGKNVIPLDEMDTADQFYAGDSEDRRFRYMLSRHEVKKWIEENGMTRLFQLLDQVNRGDDFVTLYFK